MALQGYQTVPFASDGGDPVGSAVGWMVSLTTGSIAAGLCVLAIAVIGLLMLGGRVPVRTGLRVVLGCFVLLGAPVVASAFYAGAAKVSGPEVALPSQQTKSPRADLPPSNYDPYAGASLPDQ